MSVRSVDQILEVVEEVYRPRKDPSLAAFHDAGIFLPDESTPEERYMRSYARSADAEADPIWEAFWECHDRLQQVLGKRP